MAHVWGYFFILLTWKWLLQSRMQNMILIKWIWTWHVFCFSLYLLHLYNSRITPLHIRQCLKFILLNATYRFKTLSFKSMYALLRWLIDAPDKHDDVGKYMPARHASYLYKMFMSVQWYKSACLFPDSSSQKWFHIHHQNTGGKSCRFRQHLVIFILKWSDKNI